MNEHESNKEQHQKKRQEEKLSDKTNSRKERAALTLTRNVGEVLMVGDDISVTILAVKNNRIHLGIKTPKDVAVYREEVYECIQKDKARR